jgi:hypothetical protein
LAGLRQKTTAVRIIEQDQALPTIPSPVSELFYPREDFSRLKFSDRQDGTRLALPYGRFLQEEEALVLADNEHAGF